MRPSLARSGHGDAFASYASERRRAGRPAVIDLGCGARKTAGAFGIDGVRLPGVDLVHDLQSRPYPLPDDGADEVVLNHVLEHFAEPLPLMEEVWRVTRPGGRVLIRTPHCSGPYAWNDPTHRRAFTSLASFRAAGIDLLQRQIVVVKLGYLFPELRDCAPRALMALSPWAAAQGQGSTLLLSP